MNRTSRSEWSTPIPRFANSPGLMASHVRKRSWSRPDPVRPEASAVSSTVCRFNSRALAFPSVTNCWNLFGLTPAQRLKTRWEMRGRQPYRFCNVIKPWLFVNRLGDMVDGAGHEPVVIRVFRHQF